MKLFSTFLSLRFGFGGEYHVIRYLMDVKNTFFYHGNVFPNAFPPSLGIPRAEFLWLPPHAWTFAILNFEPLTFRQLLPYRMENFVRIREIPFPRWRRIVECCARCEDSLQFILRFSSLTNLYIHISPSLLFVMISCSIYHIIFIREFPFPNINQFLFFLLKAWARHGSA